MDFDKASNDTLRSMAIDANFAALRLEIRANGMSHKFGEQTLIEGLQQAADVLASAALAYNRKVMIREGVTTEEEMAAAMGIAQPETPPAPPEKKGKTFFGNWGLD